MPGKQLSARDAERVRATSKPLNTVEPIDLTPTTTATATSAKRATWLSILLWMLYIGGPILLLVAGYYCLQPFVHYETGSK